jgi:RNA polymerase sigma-70 factor (ECF subfamily)
MRVNNPKAEQPRPRLLSAVVATFSWHLPLTRSMLHPPGLEHPRWKKGAAGVTFGRVLRGSFQGAQMTDLGEPNTEELLRQASQGDDAARDRLLDRHRTQLCAAVAVRLDRRLLPRLDPSDVVQETLAEAARRLPDYLRQRPLPFYPWLRQLAQERLIDLHRRHIGAGKRSVQREERALPLPDESAAALAQRLFGSASSPSAGLRRDEVAGRVQAALAQLPERDRELLVLRHLEQLPTRDVAAVLGLSEGAVKMRLLRALERLRTLLADLGEDTPASRPGRRSTWKRACASIPSTPTAWRSCCRPCRCSPTPRLRALPGPAPGDPKRCRCLAWGSWATSGCCARWAGAAWASSTKRSKFL